MGQVAFHGIGRSPLPAVQTCHPSIRSILLPIYSVRTPPMPNRLAVMRVGVGSGFSRLEATRLLIQIFEKTITQISRHQKFLS